MSGLFDRLGYNFTTTQSNTIIEFSQETLNHLNNVPQLLTDWQKSDLANNQVGSYLQNPVANVIGHIRNTCNSIYNLVRADPGSYTNIVTGSTPTIDSLFVSISTETANIGSNNGGLFLAHTNRLSGVVNVAQSVAQTANGEIGQLPHYDTALSIGQVVMYLVYQTDQIQNNAPIMGNFTSLMIENELESYNANIQSYYTQISNSLTITGSGIEGDPFVRTSSLTLEQTQSIQANTSGIDNLISIRRTSDEGFYANSKQIVAEYKSVKAFTGMGMSANNLVQNFVGTDKLKARINL